jgi:signal transduction histidine kinase
VSEELARLKQHLNRQLAARVKPLYLLLDDDLCLVAADGHTRAFGLGSLAAGTPLGDKLPPLLTTAHVPGKPEAWRFVELPDGAVCHLHALAFTHGWGVALLDASEEHAEQQQRQQAAHELMLLRDERERLLRELEEANRLKGEFIARMSHEFRTPLASVIGYSDELRESHGQDPELRHHLAAVSRGANHLLNLVENLLDQASIQADSLTINPSACDLNALSDEVEQLLRPLAQQKQLSLAWWFDGAIPQRVWVDTTRLKQVLINLVGNAVKFTRRGGINVEFNWDQDRLQVAVEDTGPGIPADEIDRLFEPFHQNRRQAHGKGAGLGLSISRTLIEAMGGQVRVDSEEGRGSRFAFDLQAPAVGNSPAVGSALAGRDILVVDDDPDMRELVGRHLSAAGARVHALADGGDVARSVRRLQPAAVLMDIDLGSHDGSEIATRLRAEGYRGRLVALSGSSGFDPGASADDNSPFDARWTKPITRTELIGGLAELLSA